MPIASLQGISDLDGLVDTLLMALPCLAVDALVTHKWFLRLAVSLDRRQKARLVGLELGDQAAALVGGASEVFFDSA